MQQKSCTKITKEGNINVDQHGVHASAQGARHLFRKGLRAVIQSQCTHCQLTRLQVCLVTGGGTGIGLMCTQALAANGAKVYITGRRFEVLENAAKSHDPEGGGQIIP